MRIFKKIIPVIILIFMLPIFSAFSQSRDPHDLERWNIFDVNKIRTKFNNCNLLGAGSNQSTVFPPKPPAFEYPIGSGINYAGDLTFVVGGRSQSDAGGINPNNAPYCETGLEEGPTWCWDPHHYESYREFVHGDRTPMSDDRQSWPDWPQYFPNYTYLGAVDAPGGIDDPNRVATENPDLELILIEADTSGWPGAKYNGTWIRADQESFSVCHAVNYVPENSTPDYKARWLNIQTTCRGLAWRTKKYEDIIFWIFTVRNMGDTIEDFAMGVHTQFQFVADFQPFGGNATGGVGGDDRMYYDRERQFAYGTDNDGVELDPNGNVMSANQIAWAGTAVIKSARNLGVTNFDAYDGLYLFNTAQENGIVTHLTYLYNLLNLDDPDDYDGDGIDGENGYDNDKPRDGIPDHDYKLGYPNGLLSSGPYNMAPGEIDTMIVATIFGVSKADIYKNLNEAINLVENLNFIVPPPPPTPKVTVIAGDRQITLQWDKTSESDSLFEGYRIYRSIDGGVAWGEVFMTDINGVPSYPVPYDQYDLKNGITGVVDADVPYLNMGIDTGLESIMLISETGDTTYKWEDKNVLNGFRYDYQVTAYTHGDEIKDPIETPGIPGVNQVHGMPAVAAAQQKSDLDEIRVVPNPYVVTAQWETKINERRLLFTGLPGQCEIRIFTASGEMIRQLNHNDNTSSATWDIRTTNDQEAAPGLYFYHIDSAIGTKIGKFVIIH